MGIGKSLTKILAPVLMAGALAFSIPKEAEAESPLYWMFSLQNDICFDTPTFNIKSMPEYARNVPIHPDDLYRAPISSAAPVEDAGGVDFTDFNVTEGRLGVGFGSKNIFELAAGMNLGANLTTGGKRKLNGRNYIDKYSGWGAAFTYYGIYTQPSFYGGAFARASLYNLLFLDYSLDFSERAIKVENGWSRYNQLEAKDIYDVNVGLLNHTFKVAIDPIRLGLSIGYSLENKKDFFSVLNSGEIEIPVAFKLSFNTRIPQVLYIHSSPQTPSLAQDMGLTFLKDFSISAQAELKFDSRSSF